MRRRTALFLPLLAAGSVCAHGAPPGAPWADAVPGARPVGSGTFRWFGLRVYDATLWAPDARFDPASPHVLVLQYHVAISRDRFVDASLEEMRRIGGDVPEAVAARWAAALQGAFPDVASGDVLAGLHRPGTGCTFFDARRTLASLADPGLAAAFFGIWLDPRTRDPALRRRLLGATS